MMSCCYLSTRNTWAREFRVLLSLHFSMYKLSQFAVYMTQAGV